jgi:copper homeostasis protein CutC
VCVCALGRSEALDDIVALGIPRVLTSGGCATAQQVMLGGGVRHTAMPRLLSTVSSWRAASTALQGCGVLSRLVQQAAGRISILAGGGVRARNVAAVVSSTGVQEVHSAARRCVCVAVQLCVADSV